MITELLAALKAVPKILEAIERLGDCMTVQMAQSRKEDKNERVDDLIAAARVRRKLRLSGGETQRIPRDSRKKPSGDGGSNSNT